MEDTTVRATALDMAIKILGNGQSPSAPNLVKYADKIYDFLNQEVDEAALDAEFERGYSVGYEEGFGAGDEAGYLEGGRATAEESIANAYARGFANGSASLAEVHDLDAARHTNSEQSVNEAWGYRHPNYPFTGRV